jgi:hypothetical protein
MKRRIIDPNVIYEGTQAESLLQCYSDLGLLSRLPTGVKAELELAVRRSQELLGASGPRNPQDALRES